MSHNTQTDTEIVQLDRRSNRHEDHPFSDHSAPYSVFTKGEKSLIVGFVTAAGIFSPLTAYVYFPGLRTISEAFDVSLEAINLTVTAYLIVQAIAPAILADTSEKLGRRPTYLLAMTIYCAASIGLIFQRDYAALLVLRMLQSAGSSPTVSLAFGCIGDIAAPHERGTFVGASHIGFNMAPAFGPVLGGVITEKAGWPYIFVLLAVLSGLLLLFMISFFRETSRSVVDNGSKAPPRLNMTLAQLLSHRKSALPATPPHFSPPNILPCFTMIFHKDTFPLLAAYSVFYMMYSVLQATTAPLFESIYGLTPLQAGLCYLAYGVAGGTASVRMQRLIGCVLGLDLLILMGRAACSRSACRPRLSYNSKATQFCHRLSPWRRPCYISDREGPPAINISVCVIRNADVHKTFPEIR